MPLSLLLQENPLQVLVLVASAAARVDFEGVVEVFPLPINKEEEEDKEE
jgi:hypothetical protein